MSRHPAAKRTTASRLLGSTRTVSVFSHNGLVRLCHFSTQRAAFNRKKPVFACQKPNFAPSQ
ncbi:hypothetical protein MCOR27_003879 [Pyricularia oryzae]|uniref:Uncharacterized protein n=5 Tax=Pyricularia TaxID=48558 RepID=A0ABQ8NK28_PYRGI|nr:uncharacterized protein MGG_17411 [Pyricularia oryzae 70-15]ELQ38727.1 hypothetical protein OOU_Y34scaffold00528g19 [Pyricularia oryzae Y34]KAH8840794.1 hypothetical protein MCOR01_007483 [Pyricularia oryzae]KAI6298238.1 hypothetical protein MCOR33_005618 [Pyricularia grisea]EHA48828.1 hypothetical protein MGG_17411 [Pyricularia oryzae 70-15]KAI6252238.1 hypothetical protein MCOR19_011151 [Pyricularia oryzae]